MTSYPGRDCAFHRLHMDDASAAACKACKDRKVFTTPETNLFTPSPNNALVKNRGRGRPRKHSQGHSPDSDSGIDFVEPPSSPLQSRSGPVPDHLDHFGSVTPEPSQLNILNDDISDSEEGDNVIVNSPRHYPPPMASPANTQIIPETPLDQLLALQQPRRRSSQAPEVLINGIADRSFHYACDENPNIEIQNLRQSRTRLVEDLDQAHARNGNLRTQLTALEAGGSNRDQVAALRTQLAEVQAQVLLLNKQLVVANRQFGGQGWGVRALRVVRGVMVGLVGVWGVWEWVHAAERGYIYRRRGEVLFE